MECNWWQYHVIKKNNNNAVIYFSDDREEYEQELDQYSITIPLDQLIKLSEQWLEINKSLPPFIIITEENGKYAMEACQE